MRAYQIGSWQRQFTAVGFCSESVTCGVFSQTARPCQPGTSSPLPRMLLPLSVIPFVSLQIAVTQVLFSRWQRLILHCKEGGFCASTTNTNSLFAFSLERKNSIEGQIPRTSRSKSSSACHRCGIKGHRRDVGREVMRVCVIQTRPRTSDRLVEGGGDAGLMT